MNADFRVTEIFTDEETGDVIANCYDVLYGETFEKFLGQGDDYEGKENASNLLKDFNYEISDEIRADIEDIFGVSEFDEENDYDGYQFYDFGDDEWEEDADELDAIASKFVKRESFNLREALNDIDKSTDNKYDLLNLYESCDLKENEKRVLANLVYDQEDPRVIYDTLNDRFLGKEIEMPERVKDGVIHEGTDSEFQRLKKLYKNYKQFKDINAESGMIRDLIDDLQNKGVPFEEYKHKTDNGITIFYDAMNESMSIKESTNDLPKNLKINIKDIEDTDEDTISDYLSDTYGFCHYGFNYEVTGDTIHISNIEWDTDEEELDESLNESSAKTFSQWFDETQHHGDDDEFYPFSNYIKKFPNAEVLKDATAEDIKNNAHRFYSVYDVDSVDREKAFHFASEELGIDYDDFYYAWMNDQPMKGVNESLDEFEFDDEFDAYYDGYTEDKDENSSFNKLKNNVNESLSSRLVDFIKDYDFYHYSDTLEVGDTEEDAIKEMDRELSNPKSAKSLLDSLVQISKEDSLDGEQKEIVNSLIVDVKKLLNKDESKSIEEDVARDYTLNKTNYSDAEYYWGYIIAKRADNEYKCDIYQVVDGKPELICGDGVPDSFCKMLIDGLNREIMGQEAIDRLFPIEPKSIKESDEETPYTKEEVERDLKSITHNFTDKDGELKCGFEEEKNFGVEILKQHYKVVEASGDDRRDGTWYHISFAEPLNKNESVDPSLLGDCPECGDKSFDTKKGKCTKCSYRESINEDNEPIKISSNSKMKEIEIEDKSEVGADGHPIDRLSNYSIGKLK